MYDKHPVTIEQAIKKDHKKVKRIKAEMVDGEKLILDSIYYKGGQLYGLSTKPKEKSTSSNDINVNEGVKLDEEKITELRLQNKAKSITGTVFLAAGSAVVGYIIFFAIAWSQTEEDNGI